MHTHRSIYVHTHTQLGLAERAKLSVKDPLNQALGGVKNAVKSPPYSETYPVGLAERARLSVQDPHAGLPAQVNQKGLGES
jgi:hypothetical protein